MINGNFLTKVQHYDTWNELVFRFNPILILKDASALANAKASLSENQFGFILN